MMINWTLTTAILAFVTLSSGQERCNEPGLWTGCTTRKVKDGAQYKDCLSECDDDLTCTHFTFSTPSKTDSCILFTDCKELSVGLCKTCTSGQKYCPEPSEPQCNLRQCCLDVPSKFLLNVESESDCLKLCHNEGAANCRFYTHTNNSQTCEHFTSVCSSLAPSEECISGERDCLSLPPPICNGDFCCAEESIYRVEHSDLRTCQKNCLATQSEQPPCKWYSLDNSNNICYHYSECDDRTPQNCVTGESRCPPLP